MEKTQNIDRIARELNYALKNYDGLTKQIVQIKLRAYAYGIDPQYDDILTGKINKDGKQKTQGLISIKDSVSRKISKILDGFPIWDAWLKKIPGIGSSIAGHLISLYYFKNIPICKQCGADLNEFKCSICMKESKGQGLIKFRIELRTFPTISSWWHFMGRHIENGKMPKRTKVKDNEDNRKNAWSGIGRTIGYHTAESFNKFSSDHLYKAYYEKRKKYREATHPDATKGHRHNMAWNETIKLFLSHFWQVAHILDGEEMTEPWCVQHGGHDKKSIIKPYYFN